MNESCVKIDIIRNVPFVGSGDSLVNRLRNVSLRGFPDVKIYKDASFDFQALGSKEIVGNLYTSQLRVYRDKLNRISSLRELFLEKGVDILDLNNAYDFISENDQGVRTNWTMIPPVVESFCIPKDSDGGFDYASLIGEELRSKLRERGLGINPDIASVPYALEKGKRFDLINDGSHRIYHGAEGGSGVKILNIKGMTEGFPYYAVPQLHSTVKVMATRDKKAAETKVHIVEAPGHKELYRLFPSGGIMSGEVRPDAKLKD